MTSTIDSQRMTDLIMQIVRSNFNEEYTTIKLLRPQSLFQRAMQNIDIRKDMRQTGGIADLEFGPTHKRASLNAIKFIWATCKTVRQWSTCEKDPGHDQRTQLAKLWVENLIKSDINPAQASQIADEKVNELLNLVSSR